MSDRDRALDERDLRNLRDSYKLAAQALADAGVEPGHSIADSIRLLAAERDRIRSEATAAAIGAAEPVVCHLCRRGVPRYPYKSDPGNEQHRVGGEDGELLGECRAVKLRTLTPTGYVGVRVEDLRHAIGACDCKRFARFVSAATWDNYPLEHRAACARVEEVGRG